MTITRHERAPVREGLTLEIESDYTITVVDAINRLPAHSRWWDQARARWWAAPAHLATVLQLALAYDHAWLIEGTRRTDLKTGQSTEQVGLA